MSTKTKQLVNAAKAALADLEGILPEIDPSGDREHPAWKTIAELKSALNAQTHSYKEVLRLVRTRGYRGVWIAFAKLETLLRLLEGEIDEATARSITLAS